MNDIKHLLDGDWKFEISFRDRRESPTTSHSAGSIDGPTDFVIDMSGIVMPSKPSPKPPTVTALLLFYQDGTVDLAFDCPWGCFTGWGHSRLPKQHRHRGGQVNGKTRMGHRFSQCDRQEAPIEYILVPLSIPEGFEINPKDPHELVYARPFPMRLEDLDSR